MATENAVIVIAQAETEHGAAGQTRSRRRTRRAPTETLGEENLEHAETGMPQLDPAIFPNLIFWLVVALVALYFILSKVALPRIGTVMTERNDAISNDIEQAALLKRRAEEAEASYNAALAKARDEAHKIAAEAKAQIDKELGRADGQGRRRDRREDARSPRSASARSATARRRASRRSPATPRPRSSTR